MFSSQISKLNQIRQFIPYSQGMKQCCQIPKYKGLNYISSQQFSNDTENEALKRMIPKAQEKKREEQIHDVYIGAGSEAIIKRRRIQAKSLQKIEEEKEKQVQFYSSYGSAEAEIMIYMEHDQQESQLLDSLLNYYQISYKRSDNILDITDFRYYYSKHEKWEGFRFPYMRTYITFEDMYNKFGCSDIINFLITKNFIPEVTHISGSAEASQAIDFINNKVKPELEALFWSPSLTIQNSYQTSAKTFKRSAKDFRLLRILGLNIWKISKLLWKNRSLRKQNREQYKNSRDNLLEVFEEWGKRLNGRDFHGGNEPDEADFELYSLLKSKHNSHSFQKFIENKCPVKLGNWFMRMQIKCRYDPDRAFIVM